MVIYLTDQTYQALKARRDISRDWKDAEPMANNYWRVELQPDTFDRLMDLQQGHETPEMILRRIFRIHSN